MRLTFPRFLVLFLSAFLIKCLWIYFISINYGGYPLIGNSLAQRGVDSYTYIDPIDNLIENGTYGMKWYKGYAFLEKAPASIVPTFEYAIRTPHYGMFYWFFRLFLEKKSALDALAIFQLLIEIISIFLLAQIAFGLTKSTKIFYIVFATYTLTSWCTFFTFHIMTESLVCSFLIFSLYFFYRYDTSTNRRFLFLSALFISLCISMKPFVFPVLFIYLRILFTGWKDLKSTIRRKGSEMLIFILTFALILSPWVLRNYSVYNRVFLFTNTTFYPSYSTFSAMQNLVRVWGGSNPTGDGTCKYVIVGYFNPKAEENLNCNFELPDYVFTRDYSRADIAQLRDDFLAFRSSPNDSLDQVLSNRFHAVSDSFRKNKPIWYYLFVPVIITKTALIHSGSYYIIKHSSAAIVIKIFQSAIYWASNILALAGIWIMLQRHRRYGIFFLGTFASFIIILCVFFRIPEWRYFILFHPLSILLAGYALHFIIPSAGNQPSKQ